MFKMVSLATLTSRGFCDTFPPSCSIVWQRWLYLARSYLGGFLFHEGIGAVHGGANYRKALRKQRGCRVETLLSHMTEKRFSRFSVFLSTVECSQQEAPVVSSRGLSCVPTLYRAKLRGGVMIQPLPMARMIVSYPIPLPKPRRLPNRLGEVAR